MAKDLRKWIVPTRLIELDNAVLIKTDSGEFAATQLRTLYYESASQWHKWFLQLQKDKKIFVLHNN